MKDIEIAIQVYYERLELYNTDIRELFGALSSGKVTQLKKIARAKMEEDGVLGWNALAVDTKTAYEAWGLDIHDLENRLEKLRKLGLRAGKQAKEA